MSISVTSKNYKSDEFYQGLINKKRLWSPPEATVGGVVNGAEITIDKALCLRKLEIPVGTFINDGLAKEDGLSETCIKLLESNVNDEIKHDITLDNIYKTHGHFNSERETQANELVQRWVNLDVHPFLKALVLERSIFFVILPMFRYLSAPSGVAIRTAAAEIGADERIHVTTNTENCKVLNLNLTDNLNSLRYETMEWLVQDLTPNKDVNTANRTYRPEHSTKDFWLKQSQDLYNGTKAPDLGTTKASRMVAFFEVDKRDAPTYN